MACVRRRDDGNESRGREKSGKVVLALTYNQRLELAGEKDVTVRAKCGRENPFTGRNGA